MLVRAKWILAVVVLFCATSVVAQNVPNFSGNFSLVPDNARMRSVVVTLGVEQTATSIQVTRTVNGKTEVEKDMLDGSTREWKTSTGAPVKAFVKWHGSELWFDSIATASINGRTMRIHTSQRWQLSKDGDTITEKIETDAPDMPTEVSSVVFQPYVHVFKRMK